MSIWFQHNNDEKLVMLQQTAAAKSIVEQAVEKDWWVSVVLMALSKTSWNKFLQFKGGTSLSKAWKLINRFSEDIDLAISRSFFGLPEETKKQRTEISTLIHSRYLEIDNEIKCMFKSVLPERTFLEKIFLLHEEYQKDNPRTESMSRHLYDLEKIMDSPYAKLALENTELYKTIIKHRQKFNNIQNIDYRTHYPDTIQICPPEKLYNDWKNDYENLRESFIYDKEKKTFEELITRISELTDRIRKINITIDE